MRLSSWIAGLVAAALVACLGPPPPAETPKEQRKAGASEREVDALLEQARQAFHAGRYAEARDVARRGLELSKTVRVAPRTLACLHETEGSALWFLEDMSARKPYEAALALWESIPDADCEEARVSGALGSALAFPVHELERAERLLLRSIELTKKACPDEVLDILNAHWALLDVLDQECRVADALPFIEAAEAMVKAIRPGDRDYAHRLYRVRAHFAANAGDIAAAIDWDRRALDALPANEEHDMRQAALSEQAWFERDRGNYSASLELLEKRFANAAGKQRFPGDAAEEELHLAYLAARDPRLADHDRKYELVSARAGDALFPAEVPERGACLPEPPGRRVGRLHRYDALTEITEPCSKDRSARSRGHSIMVSFRLVAGKVVAVEAVGRRADPWVLTCITKAVLGFEHPTDKYNEFSSVSLD